MEKINLDISKITFSKNDIKRNVHIPNELENSLAEDTGIQIGDGNIGMRSTGTNRTYVGCSGDLHDDINYYLSFVSPLKEKLFGIKPSFALYKNWFLMRIHSLAIFNFYTRSIGLPFGFKASIVTIPKLIIDAPMKIKIKALRGLADTDFSLVFQKKYKDVHYYSIIKACFASKPLVQQLELIFSEMKFTFNTQYDVIDHDTRTNKNYIKHYIYLCGNKNLRRWVDKIGFNNLKHKSKYQICILPTSNYISRKD